MNWGMSFGNFTTGEPLVYRDDKSALDGLCLVTFEPFCVLQHSSCAVSTHTYTAHTQTHRLNEENRGENKRLKTLKWGPFMKDWKASSLRSRFPNLCFLHCFCHILVFWKANIASRISTDQTALAPERRMPTSNSPRENSQWLIDQQTVSQTLRSAVLSLQPLYLHFHVRSGSRWRWCWFQIATETLIPKDGPATRFLQLPTHSPHKD